MQEICDRVKKFQIEKMLRIAAKIAFFLLCIVISEKVAANEICTKIKLSAAHARDVQFALPDAWPWMAAIFGLASHKYLFSGSLISKEHVIIGKQNQV